MNKFLNKLKRIGLSIWDVVSILLIPFVIIILLASAPKIRNMAKKYSQDKSIYSKEMRFKRVHSICSKYAFITRNSARTVKFNYEPSANSCLYVANHKSNSDPIAVFLALYRKKETALTTFIAKQELKKKFLIGNAITLIDGVFLDRSNPRKALETFQDASNILRQNTSLFVFPEGTRNKEPGTFLEFKAGALRPAYQSYKSIVPVTIIGSERKRWPFRNIKIIFDKPITPESFVTINNEKTMERVKTIIVNNYNTK
jgi:1-acyl-sn-glycerol-3-phosphate acyltransferase